MLCQSERSHTLGTNDYNCANGGVSSTRLQTEITNFFAKDTITGSAYLKTPAFFDDFNWQINDTAAVTYDNFLFSGPNGYPFYNNGNMNPIVQTPRGPYRAFRPMETERQFFNLQYSAATVPYSFLFYTTEKDSDFDQTLTKLPDLTVSALVSIKAAIEANVAIVIPAGQSFVDNCVGLGFTEALCLNPSGANGTSLQNEVLSYISKNRSKIVCYLTSPLDRLGCAGYSLTQTTTRTAVWIAPTRFMTIARVDSAFAPSLYSTYYIPAEPFARNSECGGDNKTTPSTNISTLTAGCIQKEVLTPLSTDIRRQINTPASSWDWGLCGRFYHDWKVCGDPYSLYYDTIADGEEDPGFFAFYEPLPATDRARQRNIPITRRKGEVFGKPKRLHHAAYWVKGSQPEIVHIMIGGRASTQGKYIIRVRQKTFETPSSSWPALP